MTWCFSVSLREEILAGINFRELGCTKDFVGINFHEWGLTKDFTAIDFRKQKFRLN